MPSELRIEGMERDRSFIVSNLTWPTWPCPTIPSELRIYIKQLYIFTKCTKILNFIFISIKFWKMQKSTFFTRIKKLETKFCKMQNVHFSRGWSGVPTGGGGKWSILWIHQKILVQRCWLRGMNAKRKGYQLPTFNTINGCNRVVINPFERLKIWMNFRKNVALKFIKSRLKVCSGTVRLVRLGSFNFISNLTWAAWILSDYAFGAKDQRYGAGP